MGGCRKCVSGALRGAGKRSGQGGGKAKGLAGRFAPCEAADMPDVGADGLSGAFVVHRQAWAPWRSTLRQPEINAGFTVTLRETVRYLV